MDRPKKILVVRFSSIGDIVLTSPIVRVLHLQIEAEIHFITKSKFNDVVRYNPYISRVYTFENEITEVLSELKTENYDLIVDLHKNLRSHRLKFLLGVKAISFDKINVQKWMRVHMGINWLPKTHLVDRYFEGMDSLGVKNDGDGLEYFHGVDIGRIDLPQKYIVISLGATYSTKRIPPQKIKYILEACEMPIVFVGGNDVIEIAAQLQSEYTSVINMVGKCSLSESAQLIENCDYVVTGDTGMMHIAAAYKKPIILFWGSTHIDLGMYPYYGSNHKVKVIHMSNKNISCSPCSKIGKDICPKKHFKCMMDFTSDEVQTAVLQMNKMIN